MLAFHVEVNKCRCHTCRCHTKPYRLMYHFLSLYIEVNKCRYHLLALYFGLINVCIMLSLIG